MLSGTLRSLTCQQRWRPPRSSAAAPIAHAPRTPLRPASWALASPRVLTQGKEASRQSQSALLHAPVHSGQAVPGKGKDLGMQKVLSLSEPWTPEITFEVFQILLAQGRSASVQVCTTFCDEAKPGAIWDGFPPPPQLLLLLPPPCPTHSTHSTHSSESVLGGSAEAKQL